MRATLTPKVSRSSSSPEFGETAETEAGDGISIVASKDAATRHGARFGSSAACSFQRSTGADGPVFTRRRQRDDHFGLARELGSRDGSAVTIAGGQAAGTRSTHGGASQMAERKPAKKAAPQSAKRTGKASKGFTDEERAAMRERARELKAATRRGPRAGKADGESDVLAKIAEMPEPDRAMAERLHALIKASAPGLSPRTWYGMPAYAKDGNVVCFFQSAEKFKSRYATFGFSDKANLDEGAMWPTSFALKELTAAEEKEIGALVKKAVS
jgi:uncharacterized protein YdhG (YjbR/CyaY superfamily)